MEQFEKWSRMTETTFPKTVYTERKKAWKAALGWVLTEYQKAREGFDLGLWDMIKKELNAKTQ